MLRLIATLLIVIMSTPAAAYFGQSRQPECEPSEVLTNSTVTPVRDLYRAPNIVYSAARTVKRSDGRSLIGDRKIVDVEPLYSALLSSDQSAILYGLDNSSVTIMGTARLPSDCSQISFGKPYPRPNSEEVLLSESPSLPTKTLIRAENVGGVGKLSVVIQFRDRPREADIVVPILVTSRRIDGFGISVPSIMRARRNLIVITAERDGSLTLANYVVQGAGLEAGILCLKCNNEAGK